MTRTILLLAVLSGAASSDALPTAADEAWQSIEASRVRIEELSTDPVIRTAEVEYSRLRFRELGLAFYFSYPEDSRRWSWLIETLETGPEYFKDFVKAAAARTWEDRIRCGDAKAHNLWKAFYYNKLRADFLKSTQITNEQRLKLYTADIQNLLCDRQRASPTERGKATREVFDALVEFANLFPESDDPIYYGGRLVKEPTKLGIDSEEIARFLLGLKASRNRKAAEYAASMERKVRLLSPEAGPLDLKLIEMNGRMLDLAKYRGKVVLIDFWAKSCHSCIKEIPELEALYDNYHSLGLEMIGVMFDEEKDKPKIEALLKEHRVKWPQSLQGNPLHSEVWQRFAFVELGEKFVVDQEGHLTAIGQRVSDLTPRIRELLKLRKAVGSE